MVGFANVFLSSVSKCSLGFSISLGRPSRRIPCQANKGIVNFQIDLKSLSLCQEIALGWVVILIPVVPPSPDSLYNLPRKPAIKCGSSLV